MQVSELVAKTLELVAEFQKVEPRLWDVEAMVVELTGEIGTLADTIMIKEGYRRPRRAGDVLDLEDDIVDVLFMLIRIALHYNIDLEKAYTDMLEMTHEKLRKRQQASGQ